MECTVQGPSAFLWFAVVSILLQIVSSWFPDEGGKKTIVHRILTSISGVALLPLVAIVATTSSLSTFIRYTLRVALLAMVALLNVTLTNQKGFRYALLL